MTYLRPHRAQRGVRTRAAVISLAVLALFLALIQWRMPRLFPAVASSIADPFWKARFALENGALSSPDQLLAENESLKLQLADARQALASSSMSLLEQQNADLLSLLGRASTTKSSYTAAAVLARPPVSSYGAMIIDLGSDDGAAVGDQAFAPGGVLIGQLSSVNPHTSAVTLLSAPGQTYQVIIGPHGIPAQAIGQGGGQYSAQVPHGSGLVPGDIVSDSALSDRAFGTVISVNTDPSDPFDSVLFAAPTNVYNIRWILLDLKGPAINKTQK